VIKELTNERLDIIESILKSKKIQEFEIFFVEKNIYETIFLKDKAENEREINDFEYYIRILTQKENKTANFLQKQIFPL